jgi:hypothetical protein
MSFLKNIPINYKGELHNIRLVNFWVDKKEVAEFVPPQLKIRDFNGQALISMVNVELENMHPAFLPEATHFAYRHVAFRLLLDDAEFNNGISKGIYFFKSFTDKTHIVTGGNLLTNYQLEKAEIICLDRMMELKQCDKYFNYALDLEKKANYGQQQFETIRSLDRAYSVSDEKIKMIQIQREKWPIRAVNCYLLETNFFKTAKFASAFVVDETIYYKWLSAKTMKLCA